jgi:uncharacterized OB-fold protein
MSELKPSTNPAKLPEPKKIPRPMPRPNTYMNTQPFWEAAKNGKLVIQYCKDTGKPQFFPRPVSMANGKRNLEWREVSGRGKVYSFTNTFSAWPGHEDRVPYLVALVELEEGVRMLGNLFNVKAEDVKIDMPVRLYWEKLSEDINYPAVQPAT